MLTVTLVASLAATALWQQWRAIEVESAERTRLQSLWVLSGALDWARLILIEDGRTGGADHLAEPWAIALEEARLSTFLSADKSNTADNTLQQAFLSGRIKDVQSRMNVLNLLDGTKLSEPALLAFGKLFDQLGLPQTELLRMAVTLRLASESATANPATTDDTPLMPQRVEQLVWLGLSPRSLALLRPYVTLLPVRTPINLNTASALVLHASVPALDMAQAQHMVSVRQLSHFQSLADASKVAGTGQLNPTDHSVNSRFFEVHGKLRLDQAVVEENSLLQRDGTNVQTLWRQH